MEPQQSDAHADDAPLSPKAPDAEPQQQPGSDGEFDADHFASLLKNQLIAYNFAWDPLTKALEALAASMARQQRAQKGNNDALDEMRDELVATRARLDRSDQQNEALASAVAALEDRVGALGTELQSAKQDHSEAIDKLREAAEATSHNTSNNDNATPATALSPRAPYASAEELQRVKRTLSNQLRKSLSAVFGDEFVVHIGDEDDEDVEAGAQASSQAGDRAGEESGEGDATTSNDAAGDADAVPRAPSRPGTGVAGVLRTPLPGVPFASQASVDAELERLRGLQAALEAKLAAHQDAMDDKLGVVDARLDAAAALTQQQRRNSTPLATSAGPSTEALQRQLDELRDQQAALLQQLKDQAQTVDKQASGFKELVATLDDMALQQKMYSARAPESGGGSGSGSGGVTDTTGPPQLDLSLVFSKIADLRRATDASLDQIQQSMREANDSTTTQQAQLDALRRAAAFNEQQKLRLVEARLALQKELLDRNQTHQDRTKPQLAEWKKQLEPLEERLAGGACDQDVMDELQQLQRNYHRTMLTVSPLIHSPLMLAESLQKLADEVLDVQRGLQAGVLAGVVGSGDGSPRVDEFATKLRYLDEEIAATQQVNVVTEKKNDPLLKSLDVMRDKLESLWSLWHQNLLKKRRGDATAAATGLGSETSTPRTPSSENAVSADALRDLELRLAGSVRRIKSLEEDVDRLGALVTANNSNGAAQQARGASAEELAKLRKEMLEEIQRLTAALAGLQASVSQSAAAALVPTAPPGGRNGHATSPHRGDLVGDLHSQMAKRRDVDGRFHDESGDDGSGNGSATAPRTTYDALLKDLTKKVTQAVVQQLDKTGGIRGGAAPAGVGANPSVNFRALLENFTHKFEDRLEDAREFTIEELAKLRKELLEMLKSRLEAALRELRGEFMMLYYPSAGGAGDHNSGDSTAVGTKPMMCVACSRPVPVSGMIREPGAYPSAEMIAEQTNALLHAELELDRNDDDFVYRAGFKMPADRKSMTLPFLANNIRNRIALNKIDRKPRRPARQQPHGNPVDNVVREAMELDRKQRHLHGHPPSPPK